MVVGDTHLLLQVPQHCWGHLHVRKAHDGRRDVAAVHNDAELVADVLQEMTRCRGCKSDPEGQITAEGAAAQKVEAHQPQLARCRHACYFGKLSHAAKVGYKAHHAPLHVMPAPSLAWTARSHTTAAELTQHPTTNAAAQLRYSTMMHCNFCAYILVKTCRTCIELISVHGIAAPSVLGIYASRSLCPCAHLPVRLRHAPELEGLLPASHHAVGICGALNTGGVQQVRFGGHRVMGRS